MRHIVVFILTIALSSCSLWPWRSEKTGTCLDDDSCQDVDPLEQELITATWYCYGADRDEPWDCSQTEDNSKITSVAAEGDSEAQAATYEIEEPVRAEMTFADELIEPEQSAPEPVEEIETVTEETAEAAESEVVEVAEIDIAPATEVTPEPTVEVLQEGVFQDPEIETEVAIAPAPSVEPEPEPQAAPPSPFRAGGSKLQPDSDLFDLSDDNYAVQLIALQSIDEVRTFAADHNIRKPTFVKIRSQGSDWFVVILGVYDNRSEAQAVAADWEAEHSPNSRPWVRPLGPLKRAALAP